jgi:hypothetical protein
VRAPAGRLDQHHAFARASSSSWKVGLKKKLRPDDGERAIVTYRSPIYDQTEGPSASPYFQGRCRLSSASITRRSWSSSGSAAAASIR